MADAPANPGPGANWRFALAVGLPIGVAIPVSRWVVEWLEPSLGHWGAFLVSMVAAAGLAVLTALAVARLLGRRAGG